MIKKRTPKSSELVILRTLGWLGITSLFGSIWVEEFSRQLFMTSIFLLALAFIYGYVIAYE